MNTEQQLEALLFFKGEPVSIKEAAKMLEIKEQEVRAAAESLQIHLLERGIRLLVKDEEMTLGTAPEMSDTIDRVRKEELSRDIGKAGLETLSIILYKGPVSRSEIDYIRGVNSSYIIRNLLIRALIERTPNPQDSRSYLYKPTFELLSFLGVTRTEELPDHESVKAELDGFIRERPTEEGAPSEDEENTAL